MKNGSPIRNCVPRPRRGARRAMAAAATAVLAAVTGGASPGLPPQEGTPIFGYRVEHTYPHDRGAFTEGLIYRDGFLYESTGLVGQSSIRQVRLETGEVIKRRGLEAPYFGEGLTDWGDSLVLLTWQSKRGLVYDLETFTPRGTFPYQGEGWGLTHDGERLIMSDGTSTLRFLDPATFKELSRLAVTDGGAPVPRLNELEYVRGEICANVWPTDWIARISPRTGLVTGWIDLRGLLPKSAKTNEVDVLNGIAYDAEGDRLFVTGKWWPALYQIALVEES